MESGGGGKQEVRKEAISGVVLCQQGQEKKGLHWGYQLDAHRLPRVSSADWSRQEPESSTLKLATLWFLCPFHFLSLQTPPRNDTGLPQNKSDGDVLLCTTEESCRDPKAIPFSWQTAWGGEGPCRHAPEPLSGTVHRPKLRDEAGGSHALPSHATLFCFLFPGSRILVPYTHLSPLFLLLPSGFPALEGCLRIPPSQVNIRAQPGDSELLKRRTLFQGRSTTTGMWCQGLCRNTQSTCGGQKAWTRPVGR